MKPSKEIRKTSFPLLERVQMRVSAKFHLKMDLIAMWECLRIVVSIMKNGLVMVDGLGEGR